MPIGGGVHPKEKKKVGNPGHGPGMEGRADLGKRGEITPKNYGKKKVVSKQKKTKKRHSLTFRQGGKTGGTR